LSGGVATPAELGDWTLLLSAVPRRGCHRARECCQSIPKGQLSVRAKIEFLGVSNFAR